MSKSKPASHLSDSSKSGRGQSKRCFGRIGQRASISGHWIRPVVIGIGASALIFARTSNADSPPLADEVVPRQVSYRGTLEMNGAPMEAPAGVQMVFRLYASTTATDILWEETRKVVVAAGAFNVDLGDSCNGTVTTCPKGPLRTVLAQRPPSLYLGISILGADSKWIDLGGRQRLNTVPYAERAGDGVPPGAVMAFDLDSCPPGWRAHESARGRVLVGSTSSLARGAAVGADSVALSVAQLPAHQHSGTTARGNAMSYRVVATTGTAHASNHVNGWTGTDRFADFADADYPGAEHTHSFTTDNGTGSGQPFDNRQASLALLYCVKM